MFVQICYILYTFYNKLLLSICYILVYKKLLNETFPHTKGTTTRRKPPKTTYIRRVSIFATIHRIPHQNGRFRLFRPFLFNNNIPPVRRACSYSRTRSVSAIFAPFPAIWRHFSPYPVLTPVQKFNAVKSASFCASATRCCNLLLFTHFVDLSPGGMVIRLLGIVEIWGVSVRNRVG